MSGSQNVNTDTIDTKTLAKEMDPVGPDPSDKKARIKWLIDRLNLAARAYYQDAEEIMPNIEYDALYDELLALEKETGIIFANSPSQNVGYEILSDLPKERHPSRMLSLDKTKDREVLKSWLGDQEGIMSWKMDGLTIVLTYDDGKLVKALTRGNGDVGEVITNNAKVFENVPVSIAFKGHLVVRGEAIIKYSDFERINESIGDADAKYKNARNLCSGLFCKYFHNLWALIFLLFLLTIFLIYKYFLL